MFRPSLRPRPFGLCALQALAATFPMLVVSAAHAFDGYAETGEAHIGTFELQPSAGDLRETARPIDRPWRDAVPAPDRSRTADADIETLFHDAMDDLAAGETASAQRLFEQLIARAPDSEYSVRARRQLADIYNGQERGGQERGGQDRGGQDRGRSPAVEPARLPATTGELLPSARTSEPKSRSAGRWVSPDTEMKFILDAGDRVFFSAGTSDLGARARSVLVAQARWLKQNPQLVVSVEGHADDLPLDAAQQSALAESRAEAVRQRLIAEGVEPERITTTSFGREQRISDCDRPECTAQNRRVVTQLSDREPARDSVGFSRQPERLPVASGNPGIRAR